MTPLPVNVLKLGGSGGKAVVFVVVVLIALAIIANRDNSIAPFQQSR